MNRVNHEPLLAVWHANRALEDFAARLASDTSTDCQLVLLASLENLLLAVAGNLDTWVRTRDIELRHELLAYGRGLLRLRSQLASLEARTWLDCVDHRKL